MERARIGIIGDYDAEYPIHRATNTALEAAGRGLDAGVDYEWVATDSVAPGDARRLPNSMGYGRRPADRTAAWTERSGVFELPGNAEFRLSAPEGASNILC